ncbi:MAG: hypothetical protein LBL36_00595 [Clostridiales Family XIII bacterium]|jgi:ABC-type sugar transport system substrate-binding protein|nr:hypothetical protein [Clostridiales Family XIII bacterium]
MKKISLVALALIVVMTLALGACSKDAKSDDPEMKASTEKADTVGYITDDVDHFARDAYNFVYAYYDESPLVDATFSSLENTGKAYNFTVTRMSGDESPETYMRNLQTLIDKGGVDGFFIDTDPQFQDRLMEALDKSGIPYMNMYTAFYSADEECLTPTVGLKQYDAGYATMAWLIDNYKKFWGDDVDTSTIGLLDIDFSISPDLKDRTAGIKDAFLKEFPQNEKNVFVVDGLTGGTVSAEVGYDLTSQTVTANSNVKHWFVSSCLENYAQGATRAAESLGRDADFLISDVGSTILPSEWDSGYDGSWKSCLAISDYAYSAPAAMGLIAMADGRATKDTLWQEERAPKDKCTIWVAESEMVTKDTYKDYFAEINKKYGVG